MRDESVVEWSPQHASLGDENHTCHFGAISHTICKTVSYLGSKSNCGYIGDRCPLSTKIDILTPSDDTNHRNERNSPEKQSRPVLRAMSWYWATEVTVDNSTGIVVTLESSSKIQDPVWSIRTARNQSVYEIFNIVYSKNVLHRCIRCFVHLCH